jgi:hypothetical protein
MKYWLCAVLALSFACNESFEPVVDVPDAPENGIQLIFKQITVPAGADIEFCTYFNLETAEMLATAGGRAFDDELNQLDEAFLLQDMTVNNVDLYDPEIAIERVEITASEGLHHVQLLALENDQWDYEDRHIFECGVDLFGGPLTGDVEPLFFTSLPDYSVQYDPGTARILKRTTDIEDTSLTRGTQMLYNFHYLNASDKDIVAEVVVNFHTVDRSTVVHPIRSAWWNYVYFEASAQGPSETDASGSFLTDVNLVGMTSHQHEFGAKFSYSRGGEEIYSNTTWAEPEYLKFPSNTILPVGEPLDFHCEWNNPSAEHRYFGLQADDEMCTAIVEFHPVDEEAAEAVLEAQRIEAEMNPDQGPFGTDGVTLEAFSPFPPELVEQIGDDPNNLLDVLDRDIMCGITKNLKELEDQYGRSPETLGQLQQMADFMAETCGL